MVSPMLVKQKQGLGHTVARSPVHCVQCISCSVKHSTVTVNYGSFVFHFIEREKGYSPAIFLGSVVDE